METRKIVIVDSSSNRNVVINTDATTFGELKRAVQAAGINYEGKDWLEGITKTSPRADDSLLPTNVNYKGTITNNLVYMLTNTNKRIKSGMDRKEIYAKIKKLGLEEQVKNKFGRNYTQVGNDDLMSIINKSKSNSVKKVSVSPATSVGKETKTINYKNRYEEMVKAVAKFLVNMPDYLLKDASDATKNLTPDIVAKEVSFSDADLNALFKK